MKRLNVVDSVPSNPVSKESEVPTLEREGSRASLGTLNPISRGVVKGHLGANLACSGSLLACNLGLKILQQARGSDLI